MNAVIRDLFRKTGQLASGPIARGSILSVAIRLTGIVLSFAQAILAARLLGVEGYGLVAVALSVAQIGATLALFGYGSLATREIAGWLASGKQHLLGPFTRHAALSIVGISALIAGFIWAMNAWAGDLLAEYGEVLWVSALIIPAVALVQLLRGISQGFGDVGSAQWPDEILRPSLLIAALVVSIAFARQLTAPAFLIIFALASFAAVLASGVLAHRHLARHRVAPLVASEAPERFASKAAPFFGLAMLGILQGELAILLLAAFASPEQAGLFQPIARLAPLMTLPGQAAAMRFAPRVAELSTSNETERLASIVRTFTLTTSVLTIGVSITVALAGPLILSAFGPEFVAAAPLLWIIAGAQIFSGLCGPIGYLMTMTGHTKIAINCQLAGIFASLLTGIALVPDMGALGAACAITAGLVVWNAPLLFFARQKLGFDPSIIGAVAHNRANKANQH